MNKCVVLISVLLLSIAGLTLGCNNKEVSNEVNFEQLFANPEVYNGQDITIEGFYFQSWEAMLFCEELEYFNGHMVTRGRHIWIDGGVPREVYDNAYTQQVSGQLQRYAKVMIKGIFEYGGKYGHVGAYSANIIPSEVVLIHWSPPVEEISEYQTVTVRELISDTTAYDGQKILVKGKYVQGPWPVPSCMPKGTGENPEIREGYAFYRVCRWGIKGLDGFGLIGVRETGQGSGVLPNYERQQEIELKGIARATTIETYCNRDIRHRSVYIEVDVKDIDITLKPPAPEGKPHFAPVPPVPSPLPQPVDPSGSMFVPSGSK